MVKKQNIVIRTQTLHYSHKNNDNCKDIVEHVKTRFDPSIMNE